ncbi:hypothetical protein [Microbulbifer sp. A4B17]|nr:hypothetical protein [Microbulbifer sp. A4B17]
MDLTLDEIFKYRDDVSAELDLSSLVESRQAYSAHYYIETSSS